MIHRANAVTICASISGILFLIVGKDLLNPLINRNLTAKILLPYELFLVKGIFKLLISEQHFQMIIFTFISQHYNWSSDYAIKVVGNVPTG